MPKIIEVRKSHAECRNQAKDIARQVILQMVRAGWRETDAALLLADAMDDYCLHLVKFRTYGRKVANCN
jgi:hypothetical protein